MLLSQIKSNIQHMPKVSVFCASSSRVDPKYLNAATELGHIFSEEDITLVYGGGSVGLMGAIADAMLDKRGEIIGVMPEFMKAVEWDHKRVEDMRTTESMATRKQTFWDLSDGLVALPGGVGTIEEVVEAISLLRLKRMTMPMIIVNVDGYFDPFIQMLNRCVDEKFMNESDRSLWQIADTVSDVVPLLRSLWRQNI